MPQMEAIPKIENASLDDYLEVMSKVVFQSGISWRVVNAKWDGISEGFRGFDVGAVVTMSDDDLDELAQDTKMIRNRRKLGAIVHNAQRIVDLDAEHGDLQGYLRSHGDFEATVKDLRKQFKFVGDVGCYHFLYVVCEEVPTPEEWMCAQEAKKSRR